MCCGSSYCGLGERFKVITTLTLLPHPSLSLLSPLLTSYESVLTSFCIPPCYSDMSIQLTFLFASTPTLSFPPGVLPLCVNPAVVLIVFLPPREPSNEILFGNRDLSAWSDVHVFYKFKCLFIYLTMGQPLSSAAIISCLLQPLSFSHTYHFSHYISSLSYYSLIISTRLQNADFLFYADFVRLIFKWR